MSLNQTLLEIFLSILKILKFQILTTFFSYICRLPSFTHNYIIIIKKIINQTIRIRHDNRSGSTFSFIVFFLATFRFLVRENGAT